MRIFLSGALSLLTLFVSSHIVFVGLVWLGRVVRILSFFLVLLLSLMLLPLLMFQRLLLLLLLVSLSAVTYWKMLRITLIYSQLEMREVHNISAKNMLLVKHVDFTLSSVLCVQNTHSEKSRYRKFSNHIAKCCWTFWSSYKFQEFKNYLFGHNAKPICANACVSLSWNGKGVMLLKFQEVAISVNEFLEVLDTIGISRLPWTTHIIHKMN